MWSFGKSSKQLINDFSFDIDTEAIPSICKSLLGFKEAIIPLRKHFYVVHVIAKQTTGKSGTARAKKLYFNYMVHVKTDILLCCGKTELVKFPLILRFSG